MYRLSLIIAVAVGAVAATPSMAQQDQDGTAPAGQWETVPLQLKAEQVMDMQQKLNQRGFPAGRVDGRWGPDTSAAVKRFQARNGLTATGQLDRKTPGVLDVVGAAPKRTAPSVVPPAPVAATGSTAPATAIALSGTLSNPPAPVSGRATDRTPGTNVTDANPKDANVPSGNNNQAIATTNANAPQPAHGANFENVSDLHKDRTGVWRGTATKVGQ